MTACSKACTRLLRLTIALLQSTVPSHRGFSRMGHYHHEPLYRS